MPPFASTHFLTCFILVADMGGLAFVGRGLRDGFRFALASDFRRSVAIRNMMLDTNADVTATPRSSRLFK